MAASSTRSLAVGQRLHHLKVFFSNRFVYAQVTRKTDGHVRAAPPPRAFFRLILGARARTHDAILTPSLPSIPREQILASASTIEREMRESLPNRSDKNAAAAVGRAIAARAKSASIDAVHFEKPRGKRFHGKLKALIDTMREAGLPLNFTTLAAGAR
jgi:large subunit ribosomal protein L18